MVGIMEQMSILTAIAVHEIQTTRSCVPAAKRTTLVSKHNAPPPSDATGIFPRPSTCTFDRSAFHSMSARNRCGACFPQLKRHHGRARARGSEPSAPSANSRATSSSMVRSPACTPNLPSSASSAMASDMARTKSARKARACASPANPEPRSCSWRSW